MKLTDLMKESGIELGKVYTDKDLPPFKTPNQVNEGKMAIGKGEFANLYKIKEDMKEGKFDPKNPQIHLIGLGVYNLKTLEKVIKRDLTNAAKDVGYETGAKNLVYHLYGRHKPLQSKIKGLSEVYQQMNSPQYKRAVTMYKRR